MRNTAQNENVGTREEDQARGRSELRVSGDGQFSGQEVPRLLAGNQHDHSAAQAMSTFTTYTKIMKSGF